MEKRGVVDEESPLAERELTKQADSREPNVVDTLAKAAETEPPLKYIKATPWQLRWLRDGFNPDGK